MRLAVVSPFVDRRHGTERALAELLERLANRYGCEIHLFAQHVEDLALSAPGSVKSGSAGAIIWHRVARLPGPHIFQFLAWFYLNRIWRLAWSAFRRVSFDLVLSPGINCSDAQVILVHALFHRLQQLSEDGRDSLVTRGSLRRLHRRVYYRVLAGLEKRIYSNPRVALAAVSRRTAEFLEKEFHRRDVRVVPNGVDTSQFSPEARLARRAQARARRQFRDDEFVLLLIGNDWTNKGLPTILEALSALPDLSSRLLVVGNDATPPAREMARRLGVLDRCIWEPANPDILDAFAAADLYVSPSREDSFGMPVAEAMACGLPAITSAFAGVSSLLQDGVDSFILRNPQDAKTLAKLIRTLNSQPDLCARIGHAAASAVSECTWDRNADAVWEFLNEVCAQKPRPRQ